MKRAIMIAALALTPMTASAWDNRYSDDQYDNDIQRNQQLQRIANEMQYQQEYQEYKDQKADYDNQFEGDELGKFMSDHYFKGPQAPKR
jgi:hypothetical protein